MRIVMLVENLVYGKLSAEHGLSMYIEHEGHRILFDTGQSDRFLRNAEILGIDIAGVEALVLSHGHYDHTGGLEHFCRINSKARIYAKRGIFNKKFNKDGGFIGLAYNAALYKGRVVELDAGIEIAHGVHIVTDIPLVNAWDTHFENLFVGAQGREDAQGPEDSQRPQDALRSEDSQRPEDSQRSKDARRTDTFEDEQFLAIETERGLAVISGCSHRGITNILESARRAFFPGATPASPSGQEAAAEPVAAPADFAKSATAPRFHLVLGGFHLSNAGDELAERVTQKLLDEPIDRLGCCHCTGVDNYARIKHHFGARAFYAWSGIDLAI